MESALNRQPKDQLNFQVCFPGKKLDKNDITHSAPNPGKVKYLVQSANYVGQNQCVQLIKHGEK